MKIPPEILAIRRQIDEIDDDINQLLMRRTACIHAIKKAKGTTFAVFQPEREEAIIKRVTKQNIGSLKSGEVENIFRQIITSFRTLEERIEPK